MIAEGKVRSKTGRGVSQTDLICRIFCRVCWRRESNRGGHGTTHLSICAYCAAAAIVFAAAIMFAGIEPLTAAQSRAWKLRKIADNVYVMQNPTGRATRCSS